MIGDESGGGGLVDPHGVDPPAWAAPSDDAYGHLLTDGQQVLSGQPGRDEDDARDPYPQQALDGLVQDLGLVGADRDEQGEAAPGGRPAQAGRDLLEEGVAQVGQHQADDARALPGQRGGRDVDPVTEGGGHLLDALAGAGGDLG